jgi:hypothetical protein
VANGKDDQRRQTSEDIGNVTAESNALEVANQDNGNYQRSEINNPFDMLVGGSIDSTFYSLTDTWLRWFNVWHG